MTTKTTALVLMAHFTVLLTPAVAQVRSHLIPQRHEVDVIETGDPCTSAVAGDFDGDQVEDVAMIHGSSLDVMLAPSLYKIRMTGVGTALDVVPVPNTPGSPDHMLIVDANGMQRLTWNAATQSWDATLVFSQWSGVTKLRSRVVGSTVHVIGLRSDGRTFVYGEVTTTSATHKNTFSTGVDIDDFTPVRWSGAARPELASVSQGTLTVRRLMQPGQVLASQAFADFDQGLLQPVRHVNAPWEWVAWVATHTGGDQTLALIGAGGMTDVALLPAGDGVVRFLSGDYDGDGCDDLLLSRTKDWNLGLLINTGTNWPDYAANGDPDHDGPTAAAEYLLTVQTSPAGNNVAPPVMMDADNDGDMDIAYVMSSVDRMWVGLDERVIDQGPMTPTLHRVSDALFGDHGSIGAELDASGMTYDGEHWTGPTRVEIGIDLPTDPPAAATHLQVSMWRLSDFTAGLEVENILGLPPVDLTAIQGSTYTVEVTRTGTIEDADGVGLNEILFLMRRLVTLDATGAITAKYPGALTGLEALMNSEAGNEFAEFLADPIGVQGELFFDVVAYSLPPSSWELPGGSDQGSGNDPGVLPCADNSPPDDR